MTARRLLLLLLLTLLPLPALAAEDVVIYTIKKGDTLWGISQRFLKDPNYWPNLWANNPELTNPHFIEPGQQLRIYDGRIEVVPAKPGDATAGTTAESPGEAVPAPAEAATVTDNIATVSTDTGETILSIKAPVGIGFISTEKMDGVGVIVDTVDGRIHMSARDKVFLKMRQAANVGEKFTLFEIASPVEHPVTKKPFGYRIRDLGMVEVTEVGPKITTGVIRTSFREIPRGTMLTPYVPPSTEIALKRAARPVSGYLIDANRPRTIQTQGDIVFLDLGSADGLAVGNLIYITRFRRASELADKAEPLDLPDLLAGSAIVLETREDSATAMILKITGPIRIGDSFTAVTER